MTHAARPIPTSLIWQVTALTCLFAVELGLLFIIYISGPVAGHPDMPVDMCRFLASDTTFCTLTNFFYEMIFGGAVALLLLCLYQTHQITHAMRQARLASSLSPTWLAVHIGGVLLLSLPGLLAVSDPALIQSYGLAMWLGGALCAVIGVVFILATPAQWLEAAKRKPFWFVIIATISPLIGFYTLQASWQIPLVTRTTFDGVAALLTILGYTPLYGDKDFVMGVEGFRVFVGHTCSGVQGLILTTTLLGSYLFLMSNHLRVARFAMLIPIAIILSYLLNTVRVALLIIVGADISPELAIDGFHSYAGWIMFLILNISIIVLVEKSTWFIKQTDPAPQASTTPFRQDPLAAYILPFIILMTTSLIAGAVIEVPALAYPARIAVVAAALWLFWPVLRGIKLTPDPLAIATGLVIGVVWIVALRNTPADDILTDRLGALSAAAFTLWVTARLIGTSLIIPVVEELFFRGYILARLNTRNSLATRLVALVVSSGLFAALHGDWILAGLAGLCFGLLYLRRKNVSDAIIAHACANALIGAYALATGQWQII